MGTRIDTSCFRRGVSNEDVLNTTVNEVELTIYALVANLDQVEGACVERKRMEQWDIPVDSDQGRMRIRKVDDLQWQLTSKTYRPGLIGAMECTTTIVKAQYDNIQRLAVNGHYKTRLVIPFVSHPYKWEVDVYYTRGGGPSRWVKIDLEGFDINKEIPEELPFDCEEIILSDDPNLPEAKRRQIEELWKDEWLKISREP